MAKINIIPATNPDLFTPITSIMGRKLGIEIVGPARNMVRAAPFDIPKSTKNLTYSTLTHVPK